MDVGRERIMRERVCVCDVETEASATKVWGSGDAGCARLPWGEEEEEEECKASKVRIAARV
jgi:hypothetical protein